MALLMTMAAQSVRIKGSLKLPNLLKTNNPADVTFGCCKTLTANLVSCRGEKRSRPAPFNYKKRRPFMTSFKLDGDPWNRFDENSKVIVIDGNIATGKTALGKFIANEFDMLYVPEVTMEQMYTGCLTNEPYNLDIREFDERLTPKGMSCDLETFYAHKAKKYVLDNFSRTQYTYFRHKTFNWAKTVMAHILNTGQGVVMNRGMWSDLVWAHALTKTGYMSGAALKESNFQYKCATNYFWKPHLVIYLDAPIDLVKENIKKRNVPWEVNSPVLTDDYLQAISDAYKKEYLPKMSVHSAIKVFDLGEEELDFDEVSVQLENLDLEEPPLMDRSKKKFFAEWNMHAHCYSMKKFWTNKHRKLCAPYKNKELSEVFTFEPPWDVPELMLTQMDKVIFDDLLESDPRSKYDANWSLDNKLNYLKLW